MPTESSAVSDLIQQVHSRRLRTDPGDDALFGRTKPAQRVAARPIRLGLSTAPRASQARVPVHATAVTAPAAPKVMPRGTHPPIPRGDRTWPLIIGAVVMAGIGVGGAWYASQFLDRDAPRAAAGIAIPAPAPQPAPAPAAVAVAAAPSVSATAIEPTATAIEPAPAPAPAVEPTAAAAPARHAKSKRATAKHAKRKAAHAAAAAKAEPAKAEPEKAADPEPAPAPPPPRPTVQRQAADNENPL